MKNKILKRIAIFIIIIFLSIGGLLLWYDMSRKQYCISEDKCITVWKRLGGECFIVPGKYDSWLNPTQDYILTNNVDDIDVLWENNKHLKVNGKDFKIINKSLGFKIENYNDDKSLNDSLYLEFDGKYHRYKNNITYISVFLKENYAKDNYGNKLK